MAMINQVTWTATVTNTSQGTFGAGQTLMPHTIANITQLVISNAAGSAATTSFALLRKPAEGGSFIPWLQNTDFGTATAILLESSILNPTNSLARIDAIAAGSSAFITLNTGPCHEIQLQSSVASGTANLTLTATQSNWAMH